MVDDVAELVKEARDRERFVLEGPRYLMQLCERLADALEARAPESGGAVAEDIRYITAALSWYDGTEASADVLEAWTRLRAALAQPAGRSGGEWRDIAEAPRDGTRVLLWAQHLGGPWSGYWWVHNREWTLTETRKDGWTNGSTNSAEALLIFSPTHFMPLPAPPTGEPG